MKRIGRIGGAMTLSIGGLAAWPAMAWELSGTHPVELVRQDGSAVVLGEIRFEPDGDRMAFRFEPKHTSYQDYFLSMKEFKCITGEKEVFCHVPYPYPNPGSVTPQDLVWLEHAFLFLHKDPSEFGAKLWNGVIYKMAVTDEGIVGTPQAVDLNLIGVPPAGDAPPYGLGERTDIEPGAREFGRLRIR